MNIEIANRLVNLRKGNNLSQEALAEKLGISRQAVSKWERAEASPDTDNLILLARLYGVSLDELLQTDEEISTGGYQEENIDSCSQNRSSDNQQDNRNNNEYVHVGLGGVHVRDKDGSEVHVGWNGIHVDDRKKGDNVHIDKNGVHVNGETYDKEWFRHNNAHSFPIDLLIVISFFLIGIFFNAWNPGWLVFLLIPIWHSFVAAVQNKNAHIFAYPVLTVLLYLLGGFFMRAWHPGWVIFLTIPLYYSFVSYIQGMRKSNRKNYAEAENQNDIINNENERTDNDNEW